MDKMRLKRLIREAELYNETALRVENAARRWYPNVRWDVHKVVLGPDRLGEDLLFIQQLYRIQIAFKFDERPECHYAVEVSAAMVRHLMLDRPVEVSAETVEPSVLDGDKELRMIFSTMLRRVADGIMDMLLAGEFPPAAGKADQRYRDYRYDLLGGAKWRHNWEGAGYV